MHVAFVGIYVGVFLSSCLLGCMLITVSNSVIANLNHRDTFICDFGVLIWKEAVAIAGSSKGDVVITFILVELDCCTSAKKLAPHSCRPTSTLFDCFQYSLWD